MSNLLWVQYPLRLFQYCNSMICALADVDSICKARACIKYPLMAQKKSILLHLKMKNSNSFDNHFVCRIFYTFRNEVKIQIFISTLAPLFEKCLCPSTMLHLVCWLSKSSKLLWECALARHKLIWIQNKAEKILFGGKKKT